MWKLPYYNIESGMDWVSLERDCDWFRDMKDVPQDHIWHAEGDVQIHTKMVVEALIALPEFGELNPQEKHIMVCGALMHDIEKRSVTTEKFKDGRTCVVAPKHANRGETTARTILYKEWDCPFDIRESICKVVRYHGIPLWSVSDKDAEYRTVEASLLVNTKFLGMIAKADINGRYCEDTDFLLGEIEFFNEFCKELDCFGEPKKFDTELARFKYLSDRGYIDYKPFDDSKFTCHMLMGVAGSGKDHYIKTGFPYNTPRVSLDDLRIEMGVKRGDTKGQGHVIQEGKERFKVNMRAKQDFIFNATNLTKDMRGKWISLVREYGGKVIIHYVESPYKTLLKQNRNREHVVPDDVIEKMINKIEMPKYDEAEEIKYVVN